MPSEIGLHFILDSESDAEGRGIIYWNEFELKKNLNSERYEILFRLYYGVEKFKVNVAKSFCQTNNISKMYMHT